MLSLIYKKLFVSSSNTKEIYLLKTIETKTHIAVFETSDRHDDMEARNEFTFAKRQPFTVYI